MITTVYRKSVMVYGSLQARFIGTHRNTRRFGLRVYFLGSGHLQPYRLAFQFFKCHYQGCQNCPIFSKLGLIGFKHFKKFHIIFFGLTIPQFALSTWFSICHLLSFSSFLTLSLCFFMALYGFIELFKFRYTVNWYRIAVANDYST